MKRLFIDLDKCNKCEECKAACGYFYLKQGRGITNLREYATFALFCRRCEEAPCVRACYRDALEKQPDGVLKRYKMLCTSCKSCTVACPFGTILPDFIPYLDSKCDFCLGMQDKTPACVAGCPEEAVEFREIEEDAENHIYLIGDNLAVRSRKWSREESGIKKS